MRIPEIRDNMYEIAKRLRSSEPNLALNEEADLIDYLADETRRRVGKRGAITSRPMTPGIKREIHRLAIAWPDMTQLEIARRLDISDGRVSETLAGFRE